MKVRVYGKINLALAITGVSGNMHTIDSIMSSVSLFDELDIVEKNALAVHCQGVDERSNIAYRAGEKVREITGKSLDIRITKGLPFGGGMGGSSADGAGVLFVADKLFGLSKLCDIDALALSLGADVPYMLRGGLMRCQGFGHILSPLSGTVGELLVIECGNVSTRMAYVLADSLAQSSINIEQIANEICHNKYAFGDNALLAGARQLNQRLSGAIELLSEHNIKAYMTGSGGCLYIPYDSNAELLMRENGYICHKCHGVNKGIEII